MLAFVPKQLPATDTGEGLFLLEQLLRLFPGFEIELRHEADRVFRTGRLAQAALHAGALGEAQHRIIGIVGERARRADTDTGEAERAGFVSS